MKDFRQPVPPPAAQPVRFYKIVAISFLLITLVLLGLIVFLSSKRASITIVTRSEPVHAQKVIDVGDGATSGIDGFVTTTVFSLTELYSPRGETQVDGRAEGVITIINETNSAQPLVATTRFLTPDNILFRLKEGVTVPANGQIDAVVAADLEGPAGDIGPTNFTIPGLREETQKVIYAKSDAAMRGGVRTIGVLSESDIATAEEKMLASLKQQGASQLQELYSDRTGLFDVVQHTVEYDETLLGEEIDSFELTGRATIVGVFYDAQAMQDYARGQLEQHVINNDEILESAEEEPVVVIDNVDLQANKATLSVTHSGVVNIDPNSESLQKIIFYGKTDDEVRRYVMSLDHVQSVEMDFKPLWNSTVPHVASHVNITVRQVE